MSELDTPPRADTDVIARAARTLRAAHGGEHRGSGFTRARVLASVRRRRRGRLYRWAFGAPIASVLLVGSAWAQSTGQWPLVWAAVTNIFSTATEEPEPRGDARSPRPAESTEPASAPAPTESIQEASVIRRPPVIHEPSTPDTPRVHESTRVPETSPRTDRTSRRAPREMTTPGVPEHPTSLGETPPEGSAASIERSDPELARFRAAHELHFRGDQPRGAIAAYEDYLRAFPHGRFVPEARYNMALDYIKLRDHARAREALRPFAAGAYGDYRRREAQKLLEALR